MNIPREITNTVRYILDNYIPPVIRDSYWFMYPIARIAFGRHADLFLQFRSRVHTYSQAEYNHIYETVNPIFSRETDLTKSAVDRISSRTSGKKILEVGSGRGLLAKKLAKSHDVTVLDIVIDERLKHHPDIQTKRGRVERIPYKDRIFDTVICAHTLEHILDFQQAVSELRRVAGKRLIIVVPMQRPYRYTLDLHIQFFPNPISLVTALSPASQNLYICENIDGDLYYEEQRSITHV